MLTCLATAVEKARASGQTHTWPTCPLTRIVQGTSAYAGIRLFVFDVWCAKDDPINHFLHRWAYGGVWVECTTKYHNFSVTYCY